MQYLCRDVLLNVLSFDWFSQTFFFFLFFPGEVEPSCCLDLKIQQLYWRAVNGCPCGCWNEKNTEENQSVKQALPLPYRRIVPTSK